MPEHTIPAGLIEDIRTGRAALVVGAGIGLASWKQLLERLNETLRERGMPGDDVAAKDVEKLLHKGSLTRAAGFLARTLGEDACDKVVEETWQTPSNLPDIAKALGRLPFRKVWTTFPGDCLEVAAQAVSPDDWPELEAITYQDIAQSADLRRRRRTLVKVLGDFSSFVVTPKSVRRVLSSASELREYVHKFYGQGSLVFVGFRYGDPDLDALLDRVFGLFEPPEHEHFLIGSGLGPVTVEELMNEHHIKVVNLPGKGADDTAQKELLGYLEDLAAQCEAAGITLARSTPATDDADGWLALLDDTPGDQEAGAALDAIVSSAVARGEFDSAIEVLLSRVELEPAAEDRARHLRRMADVYHNHVGDIPNAFTALTAALREDPSDSSAIDHAESLAGEVDGFGDLISDVSEIAGGLEDRGLAASYWVRVAGWYVSKLQHFDYAIASYREAVKRDPRSSDAHDGLANVLRKQQRWAELATELESSVEASTDATSQVRLYVEIGELYASQLASTTQAVEAYELAVEIDEDCDDAMSALERLYKRDERWSKLATILEQRSHYFERSGDGSRSSAISQELSTLRAEKLGDLEAAIRAKEAELAQSSGDATLLGELAALYEKAGHGDDRLRVLMDLAGVVSEQERPRVLRELAKEAGKGEGHLDQAVAAYKKWLQLEPASPAAREGLLDCLRRSENWSGLAEVLGESIGSLETPMDKADYYVELADVHSDHLNDDSAAIDSLIKALEVVDRHQPAMVALAHLHEKAGNWDRAMETLSELGDMAGSADFWRRAGDIAANRLGRLEDAQELLERALKADHSHLPSILGLANVHRKSGDAARAIDFMLRAESRSQDPRQRVELLVDAAEFAAESGDAERALSIYRRVLELDADHVIASERCGALLIEAGRPLDAIPHLEVLVASATEDKDRCVRLCELANTMLRCDRAEDAVGRFDAAVTANGDSPQAALGQARARLLAAKAGGDDSAWAECDKLYRKVLARFSSTLTGEQVADAWFELGEVALQSKDNQRARDSFIRALDKVEGHLPSLRGLVDVAVAKGDNKTIVDARQALLDIASGDERVNVLDALGDTFVVAGNLHRAIDAYTEAVETRPNSHALLHKILDVYGQQKDWERALETLDALVHTETDGRRRGRYHYTAGVIARDELGSPELALDKFKLSLGDDPSHDRTFVAVEGLLGKTGDYQGLARLYQSAIQDLGEDAPADKAAALWRRLGFVCLEHLTDADGACAAFEVASALNPDDGELHEQLANLFLESERPEDAIQEIQWLIGHNPDRVELYHALYSLYEQAEELDKQFCVAQALVFLGAASDAQKAHYSQYRPAAFRTAKRKLTEELWRESVVHRLESPHLSAIFSSVVGALASTTAQPASAWSVSAEDKAVVASDPRPVSQLFRYGTEVLGVQPAPALYVSSSAPAEMHVANTVEAGQLVPSVFAHPDSTKERDQHELAFEVGKRLAYLRPERFINCAMEGIGELSNAFAAALEASSAVYSEDEGVQNLAAKLRTLVPDRVLEQVGALARGLSRADEGTVDEWRSAADLTANRVGFILCNDLTAAARVVAQESRPLSSLGTKDRLRDLIAYSASEDYFSVRRHLGLTLS